MRDMPRLTEAGTVSRPDSMVSMDPPQHTRLRGLIAKAFTPRRLEQTRPRIQQIADGLLDRMAEAGPPADLAEQLALPLPVTVICELLGVPEPDHERFQAWSEAFVSTTAHTGEEIRAAAAALDGYFSELVARRRAEPADDLLSALIQARDVDDKLTERELVSLSTGILVAGYETTAGQIVNFTYTLLTHRDQLDLLRANPALLPNAIEELLRFVPLNNSSAALPRVATEDLELGGAAIQQGDVVLVARPSANRDESIFDAPDRLDLAREPHPHLAFGYGPHHCLGAQLARIELQVALGALFERFPDLRIAVPEDGLDWKSGLMVRGLRGLPLAW
nr:cytochrome P450 [Actinomadura barringtoniae]